MNKEECKEWMMAIFWWGLLLTLVVIALVGTSTAQVTPNDAKQFRTVLVERDAYRQEAEVQRERADALAKLLKEAQEIIDTEQRRNNLLTSAVDDWRQAYDKLQLAYTDKDKAYSLLRGQADRDGEYIKKLEAKNKSLRQQRWWFGVAGFVGGTLVGGRVSF